MSQSVIVDFRSEVRSPIQQPSLFPSAPGPDKATVSEGALRTVPSLVKWTGSKRSQAARIAAEIPAGSRYIEPFLGGGAVLFIASGHRSRAGDVYAPLIELWRLVQTRPREVVRHYSVQWSRLQKDFPCYYYVVRDRFNREHDPLDLNFLLRTCVNGIVRFNQAGHFNNSFHLSRKGMVPARFEAAVMEWHPRIRSVEFLTQDYEATIGDARLGDFVYLDPPYAGTRHRYTSVLDPARLWLSLERLNRSGAKWGLSFDGQRGSADFTHRVPGGLYKRHLLFASGNSAVHKVLNGPVEMVVESLYLNF